MLVNVALSNPLSRSGLVAAVFFRLACALALGVVVMSGLATVGIAKDVPVASATALSLPDAPKAQHAASTLQTGCVGDLDDAYGDHASTRVMGASVVMRALQRCLARRGPDLGDRVLDPLERPPRV